MIDLVVASFVVFAITLIITKASIFETKREFVKNRYEASFVGGEKPNWIHIWFYKMWHCPMCLGFWVSLIVSCFWTTGYNYITTVLVLFGLNWLWHCFEDFGFQIGRYYQNLNKKN